MDEQERRGVSFADSSKLKMSIPERIVLSAGYDGDDNKETPRAFSEVSSNFDETPILNPDSGMAGMMTPPSVLTIDHSTDLFKNNSPNWHTEGDGADDDENQSSFQKYSRQLQNDDDNDDNDDDFTSLLPHERSVLIAGQENDYRHIVPVSDPHAMQKWCISMQRRVTILENELDYQSRLSNVWKYFLLTVSVINPFVIGYFFFNKRR